MKRKLDIYKKKNNKFFFCKIYYNQIVNFKTLRYGNINAIITYFYQYYINKFKDFFLILKKPWLFIFILLYE